jgi:hypothetical protein
MNKSKIWHPKSLTTIGYLALLILSACATEPKLKFDPVQMRRDRIIFCTKDLKQNEFTPKEAFEACRQVYQLSLVPDPKTREPASEK